MGEGRDRKLQIFAFVAVDRIPGKNLCVGDGILADFELGFFAG
jgi:hypothetical protein